MILIELRVQRRDLPLPESVIKGFVDGLRRDPHAGSGDAVDDQRGGQALRLLIRGDVAKFRNRFELVDKSSRPEIQFIGVRIFQRVLILRAADAVFHRQVLHGLHVQRDPIDFFEFRLQPSNHIAGAYFPLLQGLQVNEDAAAI